MTVTCPACSQRIPADQLCHHREPVCWPCCDNEHVTNEWEDAA